MKIILLITNSINRQICDYRMKYTFSLKNNKTGIFIYI